MQLEAAVTPLQFRTLSTQCTQLAPALSSAGMHQKMDAILLAAKTEPTLEEGSWEWHQLPILSFVPCRSQGFWHAYNAQSSQMLETALHDRKTRLELWIHGNSMTL